MDTISSEYYWWLLQNVASEKFNNEIPSNIDYENKLEIAHQCAKIYDTFKDDPNELQRQRCQERQKVYNKLYESLNPQEKPIFDDKFQNMKKTIEEESGDHLQALVGPVKTVSVLVAAVMAYTFSRRQYRRLFQQTAR